MSNTLLSEHSADAPKPLVRAIVTQAVNGYVVEIQIARRAMYQTVIEWAQLGAPVIADELSLVGNILAAHMLPLKTVTVK